jgi:uncharacterized RDD family membrane protein YckC
MEGIRQGWVREAPPAGPYGPPPRPGQRDAAAVAGRMVAGFGYRVAAYLFDLGLALAALTAGLLAGLPEGIEFLLAAAVWVFVTSVASAVFDGQTLGKRLAGTRVIRSAGTPAGFGTSLLRDSVARLLYLVPLFFLVDSIFAAADRNGQTLRDKMVGTYVVRETHSAGRAWAVALAAAALFAVWVAGTETASDEPGEGYTSADRSAFMDGCRGEGSTRSRCACLYEFMSSRLTHHEFAGVGSDDPKTWPVHVRQVADDATTACDGDQPSEPPAGSTSAMSRPRNLATS